jgi:hypothetical protein
MGLSMARGLRAICDREGEVPAHRQAELAMLIGALESGLA